jgi:hypothetical protein
MLLAGLLLFPSVVMEVTPQVASHDVGGAVGVAVGGRVAEAVGDGDGVGGDVVVVVVVGVAVGVAVPGSGVADAVGVAVGVGVTPAWLVTAVRIARPRASAATSKTRFDKRRSACLVFIFEPPMAALVGASLSNIISPLSTVQCISSCS